jgi:predicted RNA-binding protein YlxR (DUF448 family)
VRTCVGCRQRTSASELFRVVAAAPTEVGTGAAQIVAAQAPTWLLVPDVSRRMPGRGAHLHPDADCFAKAERRRAFGRALRLTGVLDTGPVAAYVAAVTDPGTVGNAVGGARPPGDAR